MSYIFIAGKTMKITTRYLLTFVLLVAGILISFSAFLVIFYITYRSHDFAIRLKNKAVNSATLLFTVKGITGPLLKIIDDKSVTNMNDVTVIILDKEHKIMYSNRDSTELHGILPQFERLNWAKEDRRTLNRTLYICFPRKYNNEDYIVLASAIDLYGQSELRKLLVFSAIAFFLSIYLIILAGYFNARQAVKPIKSLIKQIDDINPNSLNERLSINTNDEIADLSSTFNKMLTRIERAFENERMFVSNVSHELRTPVTSIIGQMEVSLLKERSGPEYEQLINSVLEDMRNIKTIINGFLYLAETHMDNIRALFTNLRIDELLFSVKEEVLKHTGAFQISIEFENLPDDENDLIISGNERLLKLLLTNLVDNACKFSDSHKVIIKIAFDTSSITIRFIDQGIGIPASDLEHIFEPLFRGSNVNPKNGHGIGLSVVKQIADMHDASIKIHSELNIGTVIAVSFPLAAKMAGGQDK